MRNLCLNGIAGLETDFLLPFSDDRSQMIGNTFAELKYSGCLVSEGACHFQDHVCTAYAYQSAVDKSLKLNMLSDFKAI
jgi:hypothetical protein